MENEIKITTPSENELPMNQAELTEYRLDLLESLVVVLTEKVAVFEAMQQTGK